MPRIVYLLLAIGLASWIGCGSHHDSGPSAVSAGGRAAAGGSSGRAGSGGQTGNAGRPAAGSGSGRMSGVAGSAGTAAPAMPVRCQTPDCQLECTQGAGCNLDCGAGCNFSTSNRAPIPSLTASCGSGCEGECGRGVQTCNVTCTGDCVVECESATCNIMCGSAPATLCADGEAYVCGAAACEEEEDEEDAGI